MTTKWTRSATRQWAPLIATLIGAVLVLLLPSTGAGSVVRTVAFGALIVPGVGAGAVRFAHPTADRTEFVAELLVVVMALYALVGFVLTKWFSEHWGTDVIVVASVLTSLAFSALPRSAGGDGVSWRGAAVALTFTLVIGGVAIGTHLALPRVPIESSISLSASGATVQDGTASARVVLDVVSGVRPRWIALSVDGRAIDRIPIDYESTVVTLRGQLPRSMRSTCPQQVEVTTSSGAYLTPPFTCHLSS